jgi:hypothetical protein
VHERQGAAAPLIDAQAVVCTRVYTDLVSETVSVRELGPIYVRGSIELPTDR